MIQLQILNKILHSKDLSILTENGINRDYFLGYENEYDFIINHYSKYNQVPDMETFISKFQDFENVEVTESDNYLVDTIREEYLYSLSVPIIKHAAELLKEDANEAARYLHSELQNLNPSYKVHAVDIIQSDSRLEVFKDKANNKENWFIPTGFKELDEIIGGWQAGEEFGVVFARTGQGKSWLLVKMAESAWKFGKNVGYISPEMSADKIGYRFDTLNNNLSNRALIRGNTDEISIEEYSKYLSSIKSSNCKFLVSTPLDFSKKITVDKLKAYCKENKLDILFVDGITYLSDERFKRGDSKTITLTNISEDLMSLSVELKIPIIVVVQSNRGGVQDKESNDTPELENIRDSDGIAQNATKVISIRQKEHSLIMEIKKHRDGAIGGKLTYMWNIDKGEFQWLASADDTVDEVEKEEQVREVKREFKNSNKVVF